MVCLGRATLASIVALISYTMFSLEHIQLYVIVIFEKIYFIQRNKSTKNDISALQNNLYKHTVFNT